jgi:hypothetical protein
MLPFLYFRFIILPLMLKSIFIFQLVTVYHQLMPRLIQTVRALVVTDEERAVEAMELFDDLVESVPVVIVPSVKPLVDMCLEFASNKTLGDSIRIKALNFIGWLTRTKKKVGKITSMYGSFLHSASYSV